MLKYNTNPLWGLIQNQSDFVGCESGLLQVIPHTPPIRQLHERQVTTGRAFLHSFRELGLQKENLHVQISSLVGVFSPGAEPVPWLAPWQRICLMYCQEGQGLLLENVTFDCLFLSGDHPEDDPSSCLLIPVSSGKGAEKPELCETYGASEGA